MKILTWNEQLGKPECPYLHRWALNFGIFSFRLHHWLSSDDKRNPHDHPSWFITLVLKGHYLDVQWEGQNGEKDDHFDKWHGDMLGPGSIRFRRASHIHYVEVVPPGCWTLLIFGPTTRQWGFWVPRKDTGVRRWRRSFKYFKEHGHHPCDQL